MNKRLALFLVTLAGIANGIWMTVLHIRYEKLGSVCSVSEKISCDVLTHKEYSEWFGVPVPIFATLTFVLLAILAYRGWNNIGAKRVREDAYVYLLSLLCLGAAIGMAGISFFVLKKLCVFCFIFYVIILATWLLAMKISRSHNEPACGAILRECSTFYANKWTWITAICFISVGVASHFALQTHGGLAQGPALSINGDDIKTAGNPNAKVTMVMFSDFQCPACKFAAGILQQLEATEYASKIKVIYKFFPLDPSCNKGAPYGQHLMACDAAKAAVCAGQQNKFWRYHDRLFENQESLYRKKYEELAEAENLNISKFNDCFESDAALSEVKKDADEGAAIPITATPTFFFNGKKYEGKLTLEELEKTIDSLL